MGDVDFVGQGGDHLVSAEGGFPGDAPGLPAEGRQEQDAARVKGGAAAGPDAQRVDGAAGADDEGLPAPQGSSGILFNGGLEPADHGHSVIRRRRAASWVPRMASPGVRAEQERTVFLAESSDTGPPA